MCEAGTRVAMPPPSGLDPKLASACVIIFFIFSLIRSWEMEHFDLKKKNERKLLLISGALPWQTIAQFCMEGKKINKNNQKKKRQN